MQDLRIQTQPWTHFWVWTWRLEQPTSQPWPFWTRLTQRSLACQLQARLLAHPWRVSAYWSLGMICWFSRSCWNRPRVQGSISIPTGRCYPHFPTQNYVSSSTWLPISAKHGLPRMKTSPNSLGPSSWTPIAWFSHFKATKTGFSLLMPLGGREFPTSKTTTTVRWSRLPRKHQASKLILMSLNSTPSNQKTMVMAMKLWLSFSSQLFRLELSKKIYVVGGCDNIDPERDFYR